MEQLVPAKRSLGVRRLLVGRWHIPIAAALVVAATLSQAYLLFLAIATGGAGVAPHVFQLLGLAVVLGALIQATLASEALRESELRFRAITDLSPDHLLMQDLDLRYTLVVNPQLGLSEGDMLGKTDRDFLSAEDAAKLAVLKRKVLDTGEPLHIETSLARNGAQEWFEGTYVAQRDDRGAIAGLVGYFRNVTTRKHMETSLKERTAQLEAANQELEALREQREAAARLEQRDAQRRLALLVDNVPAMIAYTDAEGRFLYANLLYRRFYAGTDASIEGRSLADVLTPQAWERAKPGVERALAGEAVSYSGERVLHNGALRHVAVSLIPHRDEANAVRGLYVLALDVTAQHQAEAALRESEAGLRHAHEMAGLAHVVVRPDGSYEHWSSSWESLLGLPPGNAPRSTREALQFVHPEDRERFRLVAIEAARSGRRTAMEYRMQRPDGSVLHLRQTMEPFGDPDAQGRQRWFVTIQDVSEQKDREERLRFLAYYDPLTGLANRVLFLERLGERLSAARGTGACIGLAVVNIDRFKAVNDSYGRSTGDALLKEVAARLVRSTGRAERVARIGADQFAVVLPRLKGRDHVLRIAEEGLRVLEGTPCRVEGAELRLSTRSGIALFPDDGGDAETLFRNAEAAAKQAAGERLVFYTPRMTEQVAARLSLENKMHVALERGEFVLHYQPKVALDTQRITGGEALIRWQSPERGLVAPAEFIPVLEETGQIGAVGQWALRQAAADRAAWLAAGLPAPRIAVNVSPVQLRRADFVPQLSALIGETEAARGLDLEITESVVMQDIESNIAKLRAIRSLGAAIAVDDFGTGYSSLAYLARLPVAALKIDRSFIRAMLEDPDSMALVASIISLAHALRLAVVAEGVETDAQASHLRVMRCDEVQGFRFGRPVPEGDFRKLLAA